MDKRRGERGIRKGRERIERGGSVRRRRKEERGRRVGEREGRREGKEMKPRL